MTDQKKLVPIEMHKYKILVLMTMANGQGFPRSWQGWQHKCKR